MVVIRAAILRFIGRPILFPIFVVGCGFWYGTYNITSKGLQSLLQLDPKEQSMSQKYSSILVGLSAGSAVFYVRQLIAAQAIDAIPEEQVQKYSISNILTATKKALPGKRSVLTVMISACVASLATVMTQKCFKSYRSYNDNIPPLSRSDEK